METQKTQVCTRCGRELVLEQNFKRTRWGGFAHVCTLCAQKKRKENREKKITEAKESVIHASLADFTPRDLMAELARRGYRGKLEFTHVIDINNF